MLLIWSTSQMYLGTHNGTAHDSIMVNWVSVLC